MRKALWILSALIILSTTPAQAQVRGDLVTVQIIYNPSSYGGENAIVSQGWHGFSSRSAGIVTSGGYAEVVTGKAYGLLITNKIGEVVFACPAIDGLLAMSASNRRMPPQDSMSRTENWFSPRGRNDPGCVEVPAHNSVVVRQWGATGRALTFVPADEAHAASRANDPFGRYWDKIGTIVVAIIRAEDTGADVVPQSGMRTRGMTGTGQGGFVGDRYSQSHRDGRSQISEIVFISYADPSWSMFSEWKHDAQQFGQRLSTR